MSRRAFIGATALLTAACTPGASAATIPRPGTTEGSGAPQAPRLRLPEPTGPYPIGTVDLHLIDRSRTDPFLPSGHLRELMISLWYPARDTGAAPFAPWIPPAAATLLRQHFIPVPAPVPVPGGGIPSPVSPPAISLAGMVFPTTHARQGCPIAAAGARYPVILYSPGDQTDREFGTMQAEDLASRGYIVVTIDHTYEATEVAFPDGRVATAVDPQPPITTVLATRITDVTFVLDRLAALSATGKPDTDHQTLPPGLAATLDLDHIGIFGHSLGGATAAHAMAADRRIRAGVNLDGSVIPTVPFTRDTIGQLTAAIGAALTGRPFMIMSSHDAGLGGTMGSAGEATWPGFWSGLTGWRRFLTMLDSQHLSYTDYEQFLSQLAASGTVPAGDISDLITPSIGTIAATAAIDAQRAYLAAFFDLQLRRRDDHLLDGPSVRYPQIQFIASGDPTTS